jgi:hypothetical protein
MKQENEFTKLQKDFDKDRCKCVIIDGVEMIEFQGYKSGYVGKDTYEVIFDNGNIYSIKNNLVINKRTN